MHNLEVTSWFNKPTYILTKYIHKLQQDHTSGFMVHTPHPVTPAAPIPNAGWVVSIYICCFLWSRCWLAYHCKLNARVLNAHVERTRQWQNADECPHHSRAPSTWPDTATPQDAAATATSKYFFCIFHDIVNCNQYLLGPVQQNSAQVLPTNPITPLIISSSRNLSSSDMLPTLPSTQVIDKIIFLADTCHRLMVSLLSKFGF